jgi:serine/threonine protein kinase
MATIRQCATCGSALTDGVPDGQCPECLIQLGLTAGLASAHDPLDGGFGLLPRDFGDYTLLEEIARGGMGVVFKARQKSLDRLVAVKLILSGHFAGKDSIHRFRTEASSAAALQHPNIVAIHEVGVHQGEHYLAMDLVEGPNLAQFVKHTPLPAPLAARYLKAIAEAIHYAHERGILHRDLKPSNILIDANDQPRVTDFGLAKRQQPLTPALSPSEGAREKTSRRSGGYAGIEASSAAGASPSPGGEGRGEGGRLSKSKPAVDQSLLTSAATEITLTGQVLGSPNYIAPEQASGRRGQVSRQSDVYSLGAILYHLLTGRGPFVSDTVADTLHQVLHEEPVSPRLLNPGAPRDLETICLKCLQKEPARRYATARELADELDRFLKDEPIHARPVSRVEKFWRWCRRKPATAALVTVSCLAVFAFIGAYIAQLGLHTEQAERRRIEEAFNEAEGVIKLGEEQRKLKETDLSELNRDRLKEQKLRLQLEELTIPALSNFLNDGYRPGDTADVLAKMNADTLSILTNALTSQDHKVRYGVVLALGERGSDAERVVPVLLQLLSHQDPKMRFHAALSLGEMAKKSEVAVPALINALDDTNYQVRRAAIRGIGLFSNQIESRAAIPALLRALEDTSHTVRGYATNALQRIDPVAAAKAGVRLKQ